MLYSYRGKNNAKDIAAVEKATGHKFINKECFLGQRDNHKFEGGQKVELFGLEDYPEFNGESVTISSIREDGFHGKAYYIKTDNKAMLEQFNWVYEYRLKDASHEAEDRETMRKDWEREIYAQCDKEDRELEGKEI